MTTDVKKEEVRIPISQTEIWKDDGSRRQEVWVRPGMPVAIDEVFVDGDVITLKTPMILQRGQLGRFEVPPKYKKDSMCGVYAGFIDQKGEEVSRCPIGGQMYGEFEPRAVGIKPQGTAYAVFQPESSNPRIAALRFKRFDIAVMTDLQAEPAPQGITNGTGVVITDIQIGRDSVLYARGNIPFEMVHRDRAIIIPTLIQRGTTFTIYVANFGRYPVELAGHIVFEEAPEVKYVIPQNLAQRN
jgi:hypothetical protein